MMHKDFTYKELISEAYHLTKRHFWFLLGVLAISVIMQVVFGRIPGIAQLVSMVVSVATLYISLSIASGHRKADFDDLLFPIKHYYVLWHYFLAALILFLMYAAGAFVLALGIAMGLLAGSYALLAVVGVVAACVLIYYGTRLGFFGYFIVEDETLGPVDALKKSWHMTKGRFWKLVGYFLTLFLINLLGLVAFIVGVLFTIPLTVIATALIYRRWAHPAVE